MTSLPRNSNTTTINATAGSSLGYAQQAQQLRVLTQRLRAALAATSSSRNENHDAVRAVDAAGALFWGMQDAAMELARTLALGVSGVGSAGGGKANSRVVEETVGKLERLLLFGGGGEGDDDGREVDELGDRFSGLGISDTGGGGSGMGLEYFEAVRAWGLAVRRLRDVLYHGYERRGKVMMEDGDDNSESEAGERTRVSVVSMMGRRWEARWRNCEVLDRTLGEVTRLMARMREGIGDVRERVIAVRGDVVLEFSTVDQSEEQEDGHEDDWDHDDGQEMMSTPVLLRFRVSSAMLAETSPFFARLFANTTPTLPPRPPPHSSVAISAGEETVRPVYRVTGQRETDAHDALTILLCAAHMQHDRVPEKVRFEQFVAIAEVCLRYECTAPVEMFVAHLWLPAWIHKAAASDEESSDGGDGLVLVSYVFGLRRLFARVSKTAVLRVVDEEDLMIKKGWPARVKDRIWAVRNAKVAQVYAACSSAVQEYLSPATERRRPTGSEAASSLPQFAEARARSPYHHTSMTASAQQDTSSAFALTTTPRCPKRSHACDAANLGWSLLVLNELQLLHTVMGPSVLSSQPAQQPRRSLAHLLDILRRIPSPTSPVYHNGVCDPALALRSAVNDVYNSVTGLTLFEVDGKRHGWALSKNKVREAQSVSNVPLGKFGSEAREVSTISSTRLDGDIDSREPAGEGEDGSENTVVDQNPSQVHKAADPPRRIAFQPDEATCLRILSFLDASDDLYAAAMTNRTFYAAFQRNELALMRRLVRANRRLTLSVLVSKGSQENKKKSMSSVCELDQEHVMTEEEACRILWPDESSTVGVSDSGVNGLNDGWEHVSGDDAGKTQLGDSRGDKVLVNQEVMVEEKTLVVLGDKSLREQLDRRKGIASD